MKRLQKTRNDVKPSKILKSSLTNQRKSYRTLTSKIVNVPPKHLRMQFRLRNDDKCGSSRIQFFPIEKRRIERNPRNIRKSEKKTPEKSWNYHIPKTQEARKHDIDISRIIEQALSSITDYMQIQNETESSLFLSGGSFLKEATWARSSVRLERRTLNP